MISVCGLCYQYPSAPLPAIHDLNFEIAKGEIFGFLGPSGAGKSTTQNILTKLLTVYQGEVTVFGKNLQRWGADYYEHIGVAFELPTHFRKLTALENLNYFRALYQRETIAAQTVLESVGLGDAAQQRVEHFSKGMQNRLSVARAMLHRPELLFLDEPTSGLDPVNARTIKELIRRMRDEGATVFLTTHNMSVAEELCDRVAFIINGEIRLIDSPRALKLRYGNATVRVEFGLNGARQQAIFPLPNLGHNQDFLHILGSNEIQTLHTQEASLEDIFVRVTGKNLG
ncbi:MAG: ABC transporter ATP-binding protein [Caldilineaceae bacterium]